MKKPAQAGFFTPIVVSRAGLRGEADRRAMMDRRATTDRCAITDRRTTTDRLALQKSRRKKTGPQAGPFQIVLISAQPMQQPKLQPMRQPMLQQQRQQLRKQPKRRLLQQQQRQQLLEQLELLRLLVG
jgi:hypothetical protein